MTRLYAVDRRRPIRCDGIIAEDAASEIEGFARALAKELGWPSPQVRYSSGVIRMVRHSPPLKQCRAVLVVAGDHRRMCTAVHSINQALEISQEIISRRPIEERRHQWQSIGELAPNSRR